MDCVGALQVLRAWLKKIATREGCPFGVSKEEEKENEELYAWKDMFCGTQKGG